MNHHLRSALVWHVFSRDLTLLPAHPQVHPQSERAIPAFAFPATAGTHLPTPAGWKAELDWVAGYVVRQFTCLKASPIPLLTRFNVEQLRYPIFNGRRVDLAMAARKTLQLGGRGTGSLTTSDGQIQVVNDILPTTRFYYYNTRFECTRFDWYSV